jgi:hypothetical protein
MNIEGFVFNWKGHENRAAELERKIREHVPVTVINSEEQLAEDRPGWIHLDDSAYFSAQWNKAVELFKGDVLFHIQADADLDDFGALFAEARRLFAQYPLGIYEPNVDFTRHRYHRSKLQALEPDLLKIPVSDCTCWFVSAEVVRSMNPIDLSINRYGWGVSRAVTASCTAGGRLCVRDYRFLVRHPRGTGYPDARSWTEHLAYMRTLSRQIQRHMLFNEDARARLLWSQDVEPAC